MSIVTTSPAPNWYEPADLLEDEDAPIWSTEILTISAGRIWWSAGFELDDE